MRKSEEPDQFKKMTQAEVIAKLRSESCLDKNVPLQGHPPARPEWRTPSVAEYFAAKAARGEYSRFWPLHSLAISGFGKNARAFRSRAA